MIDKILYFAWSFSLLIIAITIHEFSHSWVAYKLGDTTAKYSGRLTLNPLAHIDPIGTILLPFLLSITFGVPFGWAKPVPVNYWGLKNPRRDMALVGLAGPLSNFAFAAFLSGIFHIFPLPQLIILFLSRLIFINVVLGVFNLIPIPPLDGSQILMSLFPQDFAMRFAQIQSFMFVVLFALLWMGALDYILLPAVAFIMRLLGVG